MNDECKGHMFVSAALFNCFCVPKFLMTSKCITINEACANDCWTAARLHPQFTSASAVNVIGLHLPYFCTWCVNTCGQAEGAGPLKTLSCLWLIR